MARKRFVAGNWKMNGSVDANASLLKSLLAGLQPGQGADYAVCVPFPYLTQVATALVGSFIGWGAQTISEHDSGAYTGEVSGPMLREFRCRYVLVGHSERRQLFGETDGVVTAKFLAAQRSGLTPILCVGETLAEREAGQTEAVVGRQLAAVVDVAGGDSLSNAILAYEPVWAIGTGRTATPDQAQAVHAFLRGQVSARNGSIGDSLRVLYGGSVKAGNAAELFGQPDIDGGLIGGASLVAEDFIAICRAANRPS